MFFAAKIECFSVTYIGNNIIKNVRNIFSIILVKRDIVTRSELGYDVTLHESQRRSNNKKPLKKMLSNIYSQCKQTYLNSILYISLI